MALFSLGGGSVMYMMDPPSREIIMSDSDKAVDLVFYLRRSFLRKKTHHLSPYSSKRGKAYSKQYLHFLLTSIYLIFIIYPKEVYSIGVLRYMLPHEEVPLGPLRIPAISSWRPTFSSGLPNFIIVSIIFSLLPSEIFYLEKSLTPPLLSQRGKGREGDWQGLDAERESGETKEITFTIQLHLKISFI